jgi:thymidylate synthase (FAD)
MQSLQEKGRQRKIEVISQMEIDIIGFTENPEFICAVAMKSTRTVESAHDLLSDLWNESCFNDENRQTLKSQGCKTVNEEKCEYYDGCIERLLNSAKKIGHWGVFEHAYFTVSVKGVSRALTHQLVRHRIASYSQQSQRHVSPNVLPPESIKSEDWYVTPVSIRFNDIPLFKDSDSFTPASLAYIAFMDDASTLYAELVKTGVSEEDARFVLPNACKTNIVITMNARSWLHFFKLRLDKHAQWEIREMAQAILDKLKMIAPIIFEGAGELDV